MPTDRSREEFWRVWLVGETLDRFDGPLHALAADARADTTEVP